MSNPVLADEAFQADFLVRTPLYVKRAATLPDYPGQMHVSRMLTRCASCKAERPFTDLRSSGGGAGMPPPPKMKSGIFDYSLRCVICSHELRYWVEVNVEDGWLRKVGQRPPWSIEVSAAVEEALGADSETYRKGLVSLSQGYGLGACAYLRRVVENNVHRILALLHELNRELGASAEELRELQQIIDSRTADKKLAEASKFLPPSLIVDGANPLRLLYDGLSQGIHSMTDDECADTAAQMVVALEHLVTELGHQLATRHHFAEEIRKLAAKRKGSQAASATNRQA